MNKKFDCTFGFLCFFMVLVIACCSFTGCRNDVDTGIDSAEELEKILNEDNDVSSLFDDKTEEKENDEIIASQTAADTVEDNSFEEADKSPEAEDVKSDKLAEETANDAESISEPAVAVVADEGVSPSNEVSASKNTTEKVAAAANSVPAENKNQTVSENKVENDNSITYVLNKNTKKFHFQSCGSAKQIKDNNRETATDRDSIIARGYEPCKRCNP